VSFSEKKFNEEFEARILKRFPSLKSAIAAYPDRYRLELRAARWGYEEGTLEKLQNAKMLFKRGYAQGKKDFKEDKKARDAQLVIVLGKLFEMDIWDLKLDVDFQKWFLKTKWDYVDKDFEEMCEGELNETATEQYHHFEDELLRSEYLLSRLKALLLVENEEAKVKC